MWMCTVYCNKTLRSVEMLWNKDRYMMSGKVCDDVHIQSIDSVVHINIIHAWISFNIFGWRKLFHFCFWIKCRDLARAPKMNFDPSLERTFRGHKGYITSINFSPTNKQLASGSGDNTVMLWNLKPQLRAYRFKGHEVIPINQNWL